MKNGIVELISDLLKQLSFLEQNGVEVIGEAIPVPYFGQIENAKVATIGLNPSNNEFFDFNGEEFDGESRRFPTKKIFELSE
jgi:hypothetical protein